MALKFSSNVENIRISNNNSEIGTDHVHLVSFLIFSQGGIELTIPPSWTSWSSAKMRMMLLRLLGSAHLAQTASSAERSARSGRAARCPLWPTPAAPDPIRTIALAIGPPRRRACSDTHTLTPLEHAGAELAFVSGRGEDGFVVESVSARWTHARRAHTGSLRKWCGGLAVMWPEWEESWPRTRCAVSGFFFM